MSKGKQQDQNKDIAVGAVIETLYEDPWVHLRKIRDPANGIYGYTYSYEARCDGKIIAILPYKRDDVGVSFLVRMEVTPCWHPTAPQMSAITGGFESHKGILGTALAELKEEAGYEIQAVELESLGTCRGTKSTDTIFHLFAVDVTEKMAGVVLGDGSELEAKAWCQWVEHPEDAVDPVVSLMALRLLTHLNKRLATRN